MQFTFTEKKCKKFILLFKKKFLLFINLSIFYKFA